MTDLLNIPTELLQLTSIYSKVGIKVINTSAACDLSYLDVAAIPYLEKYIYVNMQNLIANKFLQKITKEAIDNYMNNTLNINYDTIYIWENKVSYN